MSDESCNPLISVIIVNYNGKKFLSDCLSSIFRQTYTPLEVILVDNASNDGSVEYIHQNFPGVKMFIQSANLGFAGGTNTGIEKATGKYVLTLNNDTILTPDFIDELTKPMISNPTVGMCASKMIFPDGRINSTAICISRSGAAWDRGMGELDRGQYDRREEVFGACAGAALYRRSMLDEIGLFDADFFLYMEDVDLAFRAQAFRMEVYVCTNSTSVSCAWGDGQNRVRIYQCTIGNRNILWYVVKNFPGRTLLFFLPWIIGRNIAVIPYYFLKEQGKDNSQSKN